MENETITLWPIGASETLPGVGPETAYFAPTGLSAGTSMLRNISDATLTVFQPAAGKGNGTGVIICPGGGWRILAWTHEGLDMAAWFVERGYTAFLLKYRVASTPTDPAAFFAAMAAVNDQLAAPLPAAKAPRDFTSFVRDPILLRARNLAAVDGRRALEIVRARAADWGVRPDRIGMIGFSAGAFLVADVAMDPRGPQPAFVAPIYGGETRGASVPADAPPLFTVVAQDDRLLFKVVEGLYADWSNADRPAEMHVFARGAHGFGMIRQGLPVDRWTDLLADWLDDGGFGGTR